MGESKKSKAKIFVIVLAIAVVLNLAYNAYQKMPHNEVGDKAGEMIEFSDKINYVHSDTFIPLDPNDFNQSVEDDEFIGDIHDEEIKENYENYISDESNQIKQQSIIDAGVEFYEFYIDSNWEMSDTTYNSLTDSMMEFIQSMRFDSSVIYQYAFVLKFGEDLSTLECINDYIERKIGNYDIIGSLFEKDGITYFVWIEVNGCYIKEDSGE